MLARRAAIKDLATRLRTTSRSSAFLTFWPDTINTDVPSSGTPTSQLQSKPQTSDARQPVFTGGLDVSDARRLKALEDENGKLKKLLAETMLDIAILKDINSRKW
jgi:putative transposase